MVFGFIKLHRQVCHVTSVLWCLFLTVFCIQCPFFHLFWLFFILARVSLPRLFWRPKAREGPWVSIICIAVKQMHCQQKNQEPARARGKNEWGRQSILPLSLPLFSTCLPASIRASLRECWGRGVGGGGVFAFLFGEGKGIDISRNRPLHVDISLPLLWGRLSVGWIKLSRPIPPLVL